jgi:1-acyl-sn-glycerol-3-phosphate acyltransferase
VISEESQVTPAQSRLARAFLQSKGWRTTGAVPRDPKYVLIAAPHTSWWDLPMFLAASYAMGVRVHWTGKHTLFRGPFGPFFRSLGGVPIDRRAHHDVVQQMVEEFARRERFVLAVQPEGTRKRVPYWKSGFYFIAKSAGVPVAMAYLDYERKEGGFGPLLVPSDDVESDVRAIHLFYADKKGKHPASFGNIAFRPNTERARP